MAGNPLLLSNATQPTNTATPTPTAANGLKPPTNIGKLYEQEWADYKKRFQPLEDLRIGLMSDASNKQERDAAEGDVNTAYSQAPQQYQRLLMGYGIKPTSQQLQSQTRKLNTQQGLDRVTAYNRTGIAQEDRFYGSLSSFGGGASALSGTI